MFFHIGKELRFKIIGIFVERLAVRLGQVQRTSDLACQPPQKTGQGGVDASLQVNEDGDIALGQAVAEMFEH